MSTFAFVLPLITAALTLCGVGYSLLALWGLRQFRREGIRVSGAPSSPAPGVSILKPLRGTDPRQYAGFASHCQQHYSGPYEILFGVASLEDPAVAAVAQLRVEFPAIPIRLIQCAERLGTNGKVSTLAQMLPYAQFEHVVVNDSDILVGPGYLAAVLAPFAEGDRGGKAVGLVTVPYLGQAEGTVWSRLEALGVSTDFLPGVLAARALEGDLRFGLGSTLATTKSALAAIGGFQALVNQLADDYELGARLHTDGYRVVLVPEVVATSVPPYRFRGFADHQMRWARSTRDSRRAGYFGLLFTFVLPWSAATVLASGFSLWSLSLFSVALLVRMLVVLNVGVGLLRDGQVLRDLVLVPIRDVFGLVFWAWSY
ncbi:MAG TPA: glycosyltransferase, partial [Acidobacteriaceae bacterium]|nr:glycosyltransferase [Acidobacteriaceae bacterium]